MRGVLARGPLSGPPSTNHSANPEASSVNQFEPSPTNYRAALQQTLREIHQTSGATPVAQFGQREFLLRPLGWRQQGGGRHEWPSVEEPRPSDDHLARPHHAS